MTERGKAVVDDDFEIEKGLYWTLNLKHEDGP